MTTIATDGKSMAGDGLTSWNSTVTAYDMVKVVKLVDGSILGFSGAVQDGFAVIEWQNGGEKPKVDPDFGALLLTVDGVFWMDNSLAPQRAMTPAAMGSGMNFAIGAMEHGASPREAVEIASHRDVYTGGKITVEALSDGA